MFGIPEIGIPYKEIEQLVQEQDGEEAAQNAWMLGEEELRKLLRPKYPNIDAYFDLLNMEVTIESRLLNRFHLKTQNHEIRKHLLLLTVEYGLPLQTAAMSVQFKILKDHGKDPFVPSIADIIPVIQPRFTIDVQVIEEYVATVHIPKPSFRRSVGAGNPGMLEQLLLDRACQMTIVPEDGADISRMEVKKAYRLEDVTITHQDVPGENTKYFIHVQKTSKITPLD
jgi:hypothetical protein